MPYTETASLNLILELIENDDAIRKRFTASEDYNPSLIKVATFTGGAPTLTSYLSTWTTIRYLVVRNNHATSSAVLVYRDDTSNVNNTVTILAGQFAVIPNVDPAGTTTLTQAGVIADCVVVGA